MKMEHTERSETSANKIQMLGNHPKERIEQGGDSYFKALLQAAQHNKKLDYRTNIQNTVILHSVRISTIGSYTLDTVHEAEMSYFTEDCIYAFRHALRHLIL
jgi:hypothetical protein